MPESEWHPLYKEDDGQKVETGTEWAEVCYVPNAIGHSLKGPEYRYLAKRTRITRQLSLPGIGKEPQLPFPTMSMEEKEYRLFGVVTNMDWEGGCLIHWQHKRCGKSEESHGVMKEDLAGGKLPSEDFGENAAWWWIMILALNLNGAMKSLVMDKSWIKKRMKAIRFSLINLPARIIEHSRWLLVRISEAHPFFNLLIEIRRKIGELVPVPT